MSEFVMLVVAREPTGRSERMQVFPGLLGEIMCVNDRGETVLRVNKHDGLRALDRAERRYLEDARLHGDSEAEIARNMAVIDSKRALFRQGEGSHE